MRTGRICMHEGCAADVCIGVRFSEKTWRTKDRGKKDRRATVFSGANPRIVPASLSVNSRVLSSLPKSLPDPICLLLLTDRPHLLLHYSLSTSPRRIRTLALWHPHPPTAGSPCLKRATQPKGTRALTPPTRAVLYLRQRPQRPPSSPPIFICDGQILAPPAAC
jgi:hypothetical protein